MRFLVFFSLFLAFSLADLESDASNYVNAANNMIDANGRQAKPSNVNISAATASSMAEGQKAIQMLRDAYVNPPTKRKNYIQLNGATQSAMTEQMGEINQIMARAQALANKNTQQMARYASAPSMDAGQIINQMNAANAATQSANAAYAADNSSYNNAMSQIQAYNTIQKPAYNDAMHSIRQQDQQMNRLLPSAFTAEESNMFAALAERLSK